MEFEKAKWVKFKRAVRVWPWKAYRKWQEARKAVYEAAPNEHREMVFTSDVYVMSFLIWGGIPYLLLLLVVILI